MMLEFYIIYIISVLASLIVNSSKWNYTKGVYEQRRYIFGMENAD